MAEESAVPAIYDRRNPAASSIARRYSQKQIPRGVYPERSEQAQHDT